jgi:hypothetical protein
MGMGGLGAWRLDSHAASETSHQPERLIRRFARKCRDQMRRMCLYMLVGVDDNMASAKQVEDYKGNRKTIKTKPSQDGGGGGDGTAWGR